MATEVERLIATLEARLTQFEKGLDKARGLTNRNFKKIEDRGRAMEMRLAGMGRNAFVGLIKGAALGIAPVLSIAAALNTAKEGLKEFGDIADNARASGLDPEFFQSLAYQASQGGVAFEETAGSLALYAKNVGLLQANKGKLYATLKALNPELLKSLQTSTSQQQAVKLAADAIMNESDAARRAALSTALFGDAGAKLADVFSGGAKGIDQWLAKAKKIGIIVDRDLIARADQLGDEFETATRVLDLQFKEILIEIAPILTQVATAIADVIRQLRGLGNATVDPAAELAKMEKDLAWWTNKRDNPTADLGGSAQANQFAANQRVRQLEAQIAMLKVSLNAPANGPGVFPAPLPSFRRTNTSSGYADNGAEEAIQQAEAVKDYIAQLEFENSLIGKTALEQAKLSAVRQAGAAATGKQQQAIEDLVEKGYIEQQQIDAKQKAIEALKGAYDELGNAGRAALDELIQALDDGKISAEEFLSVLGNVASKLGGMLLDNAFANIGGGGFNFGDFLSGLFKPRASGGPVQAGKPYIVGEKRPELFVPSSAGRIVPQVPSAKGGAITVAPIVNFTFHGDAAQAGPQFRRHMAEWSRFELPGLIQRALRDPRAVG